MKTSTNIRSILSRVASAACIVLLSTFTGCAHRPLRQHSSELDIVSALDVPPNVILPVAVHTVAPQYPYEMARMAWQGETLVSCLVDEQGAVHDVAAVKTPAFNYLFADAAEKSLMQWRFSPARLDGRPIALRVIVPFHFALPPGDRAPRQ